jgi:hypothetical protein
MYLQERGVLRKFYRTFTTNHASDPTGLESLKRVLGVRSLEGFEKEWRRWVLRLER